MVRGGYFHSVGHTELNGLDAFLDKLGPGITWVRCFPGKNVLQRPRPTRSDARASSSEQTGSSYEGLTGQRLVAEMISRLEKYKRGPACDLDFVMLVDDGDCRFAEAKDPESAQREWVQARTHEVRQATEKPDLGFLALLAWPEIETWLLADWENGFGKEYRTISEPLRNHIKDCVLRPLPWHKIEEFGGRLVNGSCQHKLSARLQAAFVDQTSCICTPRLLDIISQQPSSPLLHFSKQVHGGAMLSRIKPEGVARLCPRFRAVHQALSKYSAALAPRP